MRTDLTKLCPSCCLRLRSQREDCPRCGSSELLAGSEWIELSRSGTSARAARFGVRWMGRIPTFVWILLAVATLIGLRAVAMIFDVSLTSQIISGALLVLVGMGFGFWLGEREQIEVAQRVCDLFRRFWRRLTRRPLTSERAPRPNSADVEISGRVAAFEGRSLVSPLDGEPCVAFGLKGRAGHQTIDDGDMVPFLIVTDEGEELLVGPPPSELTVSFGRERRAGEDELVRVRGFLNSRGIDEFFKPVLIAEGRLRPGDRVRARGVLTDRPDPNDEASGFRQVAMGRSLLDASGHPLIVELRS